MNASVGPVARPVEHTPAPARILAQDDPRELGAEAAAEQAMIRDIGALGDFPTSPQPVVRGATGSGATGSGEPLPDATRAFLEPRFGADLRHVRVHHGAGAETVTRRLGARAATSGSEIWFGPAAYQPETTRGRRLLAHEIAHVLDPSIATGSAVGRSVDDWLQGTPSYSTWGESAIHLEIDELQAWLDRQITSSMDATRIRDALTELNRELARRGTQRRQAARARPRRQRAADGPPPSRRPRVLVERNSVSYADPAEMRAEYDLVLEWLARRDVPTAERRILEIERDNLAPQFAQERARVATQHRVERLQTALTPGDRDVGHELEVAARTITGITRDPGDPNISYIYDARERIPITSAQVSALRGEIDRQLGRASRLISGDVDYSWGRYQAQVSLNDDTFLIDDIAGWLGGVSDPKEELTRRRRRILRELRAYDELVRSGRIVEAAAALPAIERQGQTIHAVARAFYDGYIEGAERAVGILEITRDVSFAVAGSIAAVLAAPLVAGAVSGAGLTGASATVATIGGTGLVVGSGTGVVRGGAAATGVLASGGSLSEAGRAFTGEGSRGFYEGFLAGAGGGAARVLGPALGVGGQVGGQLVRRAAAEAIVNGTSTMVDTLVRTGSIEQAVAAGLRSAALSVPGAVVGGSSSRLARELGGPLASGGTAYLGAIASGQSREEALRAAGVAVTTSIVMNRATHGADADARLEQRGRDIGQRIAGPARGSSGPPSVADVLTPIARAGPGQQTAQVAPQTETSVPVDATVRGETPAPMAVAHAQAPEADPNQPAPSQAAASVEHPSPAEAVGSSESAHASPAAPEAQALTPGVVAGRAESPHAVPARAGDRRRLMPDPVVDDFLARLDEPGNPFVLDVSERRSRQLATGERDFALDTPVAFDIDEPHAVGQPGISPQRAHDRATDPHNRQLLDPRTNRDSKHVAAGDVARHRTRLDPVSVADDPAAIFTRRFDEVTEMHQVFDEAAARVASRRDLRPTEVKQAINATMRDIIRNGSSPSGAAVRDALRSQGFEVVPGRGIVAVRSGQ